MGTNTRTEGKHTHNDRGGLDCPKSPQSGPKNICDCLILKTTSRPALTPGRSWLHSRAAPRKVPCSKSPLPKAHEDSGPLRDHRGWLSSSSVDRGRVAGQAHKRHPWLPGQPSRFLPRDAVRATAHWSLPCVSLVSLCKHAFDNPVWLHHFLLGRMGYCEKDSWSCSSNTGLVGSMESAASYPGAADSEDSGTGRDFQELSGADGGSDNHVI